MITTFDQLPLIRKQHHAQQVVFMGGCFDIVHEGHITGLQYCRDMGDILVVGVSSDERVRQRKGPERPIRHELARLSVVAALRMVDYAFVMPMPEEDTPTIQVIKSLRPDIFADHEENLARWTDAADEIAALGTQLRFNEAPRLSSTTSIINRIKSLSITCSQSHPPSTRES
jgi:rfaE bifunctional protein nucleotidyltransferase chain/domain